MTRILGIDPGVTGALVLLDEKHRLTAHDMPTVTIKSGRTTKQEISEAELVRLVRDLRPDVAVLEQVSAMPGQGVTSMFRFGMSYGMARVAVVAAGARLEFITPPAWKRAVGLGAGQPKDAARLRAQQVFPAQAELFALKKHSGRADAALIALAYLDF